MSTATFFMDNFGRHFIKPTGDNWADVGQVLRGSYAMTGKPSVSRMQSGWAIVRPGSATLQLDLAIPVIQKSRMTRFEAFAAELADWDGLTPRIFMLFDKAPIAAQDILFRWTNGMFVFAPMRVPIQQTGQPTHPWSKE